jgi:hypothetical protein
MKLIVCILGGIILTSPCFAWEPDPWGLYSFCEYHEFIFALSLTPLERPQDGDIVMT